MRPSLHRRRRNNRHHHWRSSGRQKKRPGKRKGVVEAEERKEEEDVEEEAKNVVEVVEREVVDTKKRRGRPRKRVEALEVVMVEAVTSNPSQNRAETGEGEVQEATDSAPSPRVATGTGGGRKRMRVVRSSVVEGEAVNEVKPSLERRRSQRINASATSP